MSNARLKMVRLTVLGLSLLVTPLAQAVTDGFNMTEVGYALNGGKYDIGPYSKIGTWPVTDGNIFYSPCYATGPLVENIPGALQCFMTVDLSDPKNPKRLATVYAYDREKSPAPAATASVWTSATLANLPVASPCGTFKDNPENPNPTCWDPGWNTHMHYAQMQIVGNKKILAVNQERKRGLNTDRQANYHGVSFYDVTLPDKPKFLSRWEAPAHFDTTTKRFVDAAGCHHFNWGGNYLYIGTEYDGFVGRVLVILDASNPNKPFEASKWWLTGQKRDTEYATASWTQQNSFSSPIKLNSGTGKLNRHVGQHYVSVYGDRAYLSYHQAGLIILDISDKMKPKMISRVDYLDPAVFTVDEPADVVAKCGAATGCGNAHAAKLITGREMVIVSDEYFACPYGYVRIVDVSDEENPEIIGRFKTDMNTHCDPAKPADDKLIWPMRGPSAHLGNAWNSDLYFMAWYGMGVRAIDVSNPYSPKEVGYFEYDITDDLAKDFNLSDWSTDTINGLKGSDTYDVIFGPDNLLYVTDGSSGMRVVKCELPACRQPPIIDSRAGNVADPSFNHSRFK